MSGAHWRRSVIIEIDKSSRRVATINNTRDAARYLLDEWPVRAGRSYHQAILGCARALRGDISDGAVRQCLLDAAKDAALHAEVVQHTDDDPFELDIAEICEQIAFLDGIASVQPVPAV